MHIPARKSGDVLCELEKSIIFALKFVNRNRSDYGKEEKSPLF